MLARSSIANYTNSSFREILDTARMTIMKYALTILLPILLLLASPPPASAHAFGKLYNLPVPFWMYLFGSAAALIVSFLIIGYFLTKHDEKTTYPKTQIPFLHHITNRWLIGLAKTTSVLLLSFTILTGFLGEDSSYFNFNMTFFWILFVLGNTYLTALIGNVWTTINPWKIIAETFEYFHGKEIKGILAYPENFGYYPALITYFLFIWIELFAQTTPFSLSLFLVQYTFLTLFGMYLFGKKSWLSYGEFFGVFFGLISNVAALVHDKRTFFLRPPFMGLLARNIEHFSLLLFILFMLSSTAFDGLRETIPFANFYWQFLTILPYSIFQMAALLASPFIFLSIYAAFIFLTKRITKSKTPLMELALHFAPSLIPIALVYNIAHYYTLLLTQGQEMVRLLSDPFGWGWNLFNTANFTPNMSIIDANITWHAQVAFILLGHIAGVYLAHVIALKLFPSRKMALLSQLPMLILMVTYTTIGLWILSQPITSG